MRQSLLLCIPTLQFFFFKTSLGSDQPAMSVLTELCHPPYRALYNKGKPPSRTPSPLSQSSISFYPAPGNFPQPPPPSLKICTYQSIGENAFLRSCRPSMRPGGSAWITGAGTVRHPGPPPPYEGGKLKCTKTRQNNGLRKSTMMTTAVVTLWGWMGIGTCTIARIARIGLYVFFYLSPTVSDRLLDQVQIHDRGL